MQRIVAQGLRRFSPVLAVAGLALAGVGFGAATDLGATTTVAVWVAVGSALATVGLILLLMRIAYPPLAYDAAAGVLHLGRHRIPAAAVVAATRSESVGRASYLTYRLTTDRGRRIRVLVAGRPLPGLDRGGLAALRRLVADAAIVAPDDGLTEGQRAMISSVDANANHNPVGRRTLLRELDRLLSDDGTPPPEDLDAVEDAPPDETELAVWAELGVHDPEEDEADARRILASLDPGVRRLARVAGWATALAVLSALVVVVVAAVRESAGASFSDEENARIALGFAGPLGLALVTYLVWAGAADARTRRERAAGDAWLTAEPGRRVRGLPMTFQLAWLTPARRLRTSVAFALLVLSLLVLTTGIILALAPEVPGSFGIWLGVAGLGLAATVGSVLVLRAARQAARADHRAFALRAGPLVGL